MGLYVPFSTRVFQDILIVYLFWRMRVGFSVEFGNEAAYIVIISKTGPSPA